MKGLMLDPNDVYKCFKGFLMVLNVGLASLLIVFMIKHIDYVLYCSCIPPHA